MSGTQLVLTHRSAGLLAAATAARLVTRLTDVQAAGRVPAVVLTGGTIAAAVHEAVASSPARDAVDWRQVDFWFGDERYVPATSEDRNGGQAAAAMLDRLAVDPSRVHEMPPSDGGYDGAEAAAAAYAQELLAANPDTTPGTPWFDVLMLGIGPDGHCASLFPGRPEVHDRRPVVAVHDSPKPPPTRITLTLDPLGRAREVWLVASGSAKAEAVRDALAGADVSRVPAAGPRGLERTLWILDDEAASLLRR